MSDDPWRWSANRIACEIRQKSVSSREVVEAHLDRISAVNSKVNAITVVQADAALEAAEAADKSIASGIDPGPLHGVPVTIKENIDVAGSATTQGLVSRAGTIADKDAPVVRHLKEAGAIVIARTNMPDFGLRWHTDNDLHGPTLNPWNAGRTPGGSSGGEAAAIATGMSPLGIGNDMGGSTRQPAVNCGITGLRPTTGRVSRVMSEIFDYAPMYYEQIAAVNGPMARHVADLRLALEVMSQPDPSDPIWTPSCAPLSPRDGVMRVGLVMDPSGDGIAPVVANALFATAAVLEKAGYIVEDVAPPYIDEADQTIDDLAISGLSDMDETLALISEDAGRVLKAVLPNDLPGPADFANAIAQRHRIGVAWCELMARFPLILGPVSTMEPFEVGYDTGGPEVMRRLIRSFRLTELCNLLGLPSVALPALVENGLPQGVQLIGRQFDEGRCFDAAEIIERAADISTPLDPIRHQINV